MVVWDFCFWAIWAAKPVHKKSLGANFKQLLRHCFHIFFHFFETPIASAVKNCIIKFSNMKKFEIYWFFWNKTGFVLGLQKFSNLSVLQKGLLLQDWVFRLGKFLLDPKIHFLSLIYKLVFFKKYIWKYMKKEMAPPGFDPGPIRLGATCSTNWAIEA